MRNMKFAAQLLVFATLWATGVCENYSLMAPTNLQTDDGSVGAVVVSDTCNICGEGEVGNSLGIVSLSDGTMTCESLESTASKGGISQADCPGIQALASTACSCSLDTISRVELVDPVFCQVCGVGKVVGNSGRLSNVPGIGVISCSALANMGKAGNIDESQCASVQIIASEDCQCIPMGAAPVTPPPSPLMARGPVQLTDSASASEPILEEASPFVCSICGDGMLIMFPNATVEISSQPNRTCFEYEQAANSGSLPEDRCGLVQQMATTPCGCLPQDPVGESLSDPADEPRSDPVVCSICGDGMSMMLPNATLDISSLPDRTCFEYEQAANFGSLPEAQCVLVQENAATPCGCVRTPTSEPSQSAAPTVSGMPSLTPTSTTTSEPSQSAAPTVSGMPSLTPTSTPTSEPSQSAAPTATVSGMPSLTPTSTPSSEPSQSAAPTVSGMPSLTPTSEPSQSAAPTVYVTPVVTFEGCFDDLTDIYALERDLENPTILRKYVLCPDTKFQIGIVNDDGEIGEGQHTIQLRPNVIYQCGEDGKRSNGCIVEGGDFGLTSFYGVYNDIYETVENVMIKGLTFQSQQLFSVVLEAAGDISFLDCAFFNQGNSVPIILQWEGKGPEPPADDSITRNLRASVEQNALTAAQKFYTRHSKSLQAVSPTKLPTGGRKLQEGDSHHIVTFQDCVFKDNYATKTSAFPGVIENTFGSKLIVRNCLFEGNDFGGGDSNPAPFGYAIRSFGPLTLENTCFVDNSFHNYGPVLVFGAPYEASDNYISTDETNLKCELISLFETQDQATNDAPTCIESDLDTCGFTQAPTSAPTVADDLDGEDDGDDTGDNVKVKTEVEDRGSGSSTRHCSLVVLISLGMATLVT